MAIDKLPSGAYRYRKMIDGQNYSFTFDHYPTEKEVLIRMSESVDRINTSRHISFKVASGEYCKLKKNVLSPTTYKEYLAMPKRLSNAFNSLYIDDITQIDVQAEINRLAGDKSPKTVRNYHGFISAVLKMYRPELILNTTLPQKQVKEVYIPTDEELKKIFEYSKNHCKGRYYVPIVLACYGMRRGEICALNPEDITDGIARITKTKIFNSNKKWVIKDFPKNETSTRKIPVPDDIVEIINAQGYVYNGHPNDITCFLADACEALNIQHFSLHKLRHYFCSRLSAENVDVATIMSLGGWKSDYVLKNIYRHQVNDKVKEASSKLSGILFS